MLKYHKRPVEFNENLSLMVKSTINSIRPVHNTVFEAKLSPPRYCNTHRRIPHSTAAKRDKTRFALPKHKNLKCEFNLTARS